ncbi:MAG: Rrf2 family transcriptional regulator [Gemmataceae bacterium]|jgi:Rrf2 family nitric oxide-sensitive transcriptional repressor|nr:Rrf2 family transcriptional regulator [Gemmataceae bacterium]
MFSQTVEYSLRAVAHLAKVAPAVVSVREMASAIRVPEAYLAKVLQHLADSNIVVTRRGKGGGAALARRTSDVTLLEVVQAVDPIHRIKTCPMGLSSHGSKLCPLHRHLDTALAAMIDAFGKTTLFQIMNDPDPVKPLCEVESPGMVQLGMPCAPGSRQPEAKGS